MILFNNMIFNFNLLKKHKITGFVIVIFFLLFYLANLNFTQYIEINQYQNNETNLKLAKDLYYYDRLYFKSKLNNIGEDTFNGLRLGYSNSSSGKIFFKIIYDLKNIYTLIKLKNIHDQFENLIPQMVASHIDNQSLFNTLTLTGKSWVNKFFSIKANELYDQSSILLLGDIKKSDFQSTASKLLKEYGEPEIITFQRAQYYDHFNNIPEYISLNYLVKFSNNKYIEFNVSIHQENNHWRVIGISL